MLVSITFPVGPPPPPTSSHTVLSKLLRRILLAALLMVVLFEAAGWLIFKFPLDPPRTLLLKNDLPGCTKDVKLVFDRRQTRRFSLADQKQPGTVRIFCLGGWATLAMNQNDPDTWWGRLQSALTAKGLKVETAARGAERTSLADNVALTSPIIESLRPDIIIVNAGFDDALVHPLDYQYNAAAVAARLTPQPPSLRDHLVSFSQSVRFKRWWSTRREMGLAQNTIGRTDALRTSISNAQAAVAKLPVVDGVPRNPPNDPLAEYLDALKALDALAARTGASLILTGEPSLLGEFTSISDEERLLGYVSASIHGDRADRPARPLPSWILSEMNRFASATQSHAAAKGIPWINLNGLVPRDTNHFVTEVMLTDAGAAKMAEILLPTVEPVVRSKSTR